MSACLIHRADARREYLGEERWQETTLDLEQALVAGEAHLAWRVVGDLRVLVDLQHGLLQIQRRSKKRRRVLGGEGGQMRYLEDPFEDPGRYLCILRKL